MTNPTPEERAEALAQLFHETYEQLAPTFGYTTRPESAVPWQDLPRENRLLMIAVCRQIDRAAESERAELAREVERLRKALTLTYESIDNLCARPGTCMAVRPRAALSEPTEGEWRGVYPGMCIDPETCRGKTHCPRKLSCCE